MGKTFIIALMILFVVNSLALLGLMGYGAATGRFDQEKRQQYLATWRGEKLVSPPPEEQAKEEEEPTQETGTKILAAQLEREIINRELQLYAQQLRDKEFTITVARDKLQKDLLELQSRRDEFQDEVTQRNEKAREEGFQKALRNYSTMKAKYVKDDFMQMEDKDVVRYLTAMKPDVATAILERFKTPEEMAKRLRVMQLLEEEGIIDINQNRNVSSNSTDIGNS
ncbi:MAG: hypothetical protein JW860_16190 [Sedimentisphaerales bacterium]|nr:hypothetical protein [Sedimentisphaerales bacterium]